MARNIKYIGIFLAVFAATSAYALTLSSPNDLILKPSVVSPEPGEEFKIDAQSFTFDTVRADFRWFLNGKLVDSGKGLAEKTFTAGKLGSVINISVSVSSEEGLSFNKEISVPINDIDLIVSPLTYTPPFYKGSPLPTPGSQVEIVALPHLFFRGEKLQTKNLVYEWQIDNKFIKENSGGGKNKLLVALADVGGSAYTISVTVSSPDGSVSVKRSVNVSTANPEILFYKISSLAGFEALAKTGFQALAGDKLSISAEPYFFDLALLKEAAITWLTNGAAIPPSSANPRLLDLSAPEGTASAGSFDFQIESARSIFQNAKASLSINATP